MTTPTLAKRSKWRQQNHARLRAAGYTAAEIREMGAVNGRSELNAILDRYDALESTDGAGLAALRAEHAAWEERWRAAWKVCRCALIPIKAGA